MPATFRAPLTAPEGVVDRVHRRTAHGRPPAQMALATGLAELDVLVVGVADASNRGPAQGVHQAQLAGRQQHDGVLALARRELSRDAGRTTQLPAFARLDLDVVDLQTDGNVRQAHRVAG